ncbi:uncharacterized protein LOC134795709 isoform X1 [Cydia splendana]|uniref:uncharacterized protein LOC134795709 isoform X1 n=1 Tax=Cydia splendana TaxID=1100963 RepID=UPI00300D0A16
MLLFILSISVHLASGRFLVSYPVLKVVHGNISLMDDLKVPPPSRRDGTENDITFGGNEEMPDFHEFLNEIEDLQLWNKELTRTSTSHDLDLKDLDDASKMLTNIKENLKVVTQEQLDTRRQNEDLKLPHEINDLWKDPVKFREWYYMKLCLTFLIHIRFQMDTAIRQKMAANAYPGYRIGYLFNRVMKIKNQMYKLKKECDRMTTVKTGAQRSTACCCFCRCTRECCSWTWTRKMQRRWSSSSSSAGSNSRQNITCLRPDLSSNRNGLPCFSNCG